MPDISNIHCSLSLPASYKFADSTNFYTLPVIQDTTIGTTVGNSFKIAVYL